MTTQQPVITAIKKVLDKGDIECPGSPADLNMCAPALHSAKPNDLNPLQKLLFYLASSRFASIEKARRLLGYVPRYDMAAGLKEAVKWYRENLV
jgi:nucleoside-diphosphate-sugar epimerase